jgi:regulator of protease activity HflC (stomatin/prohibitin superfamily)
MITEKKGFSINGYLAFFVVLPLLQISFGIMLGNHILLPVSIVCSVLVLICWAGFFMVQPNQAKVMTLFGSYVGTEKRNGLRWTIPFFMRKTVSLRIRNFESALK